MESNNNNNDQSSIGPFLIIDERSDGDDPNADRPDMKRNSIMKRGMVIGIKPFVQALYISHLDQYVSVNNVRYSTAWTSVEILPSGSSVIQYPVRNSYNFENLPNNGPILQKSQTQSFKPFCQTFLPYTLLRTKTSQLDGVLYECLRSTSKFKFSEPNQISDERNVGVL